MARGIRGSYKEKRELREGSGSPDVAKKEKVGDADNKAEEVLVDELQAYGSSSEDAEEGDENTAPDPAKSPETEPQNDLSLPGLPDAPVFSFKFEKVPAGANVIVRVTRSDGRITSINMPNMMRADEYIRAQKKKMAKAAEDRLHQNNLRKHQPAVFTPKYGGGVIETAHGEITITAVMGKKETVVVIPEIAEEVLKWLSGRAVASWSVGDHGLRLVTHPDFKSLTFNWVGGHVHKS